MGYSGHDERKALGRVERDMAPGLRIDDQATRDAHLNAIETEIRAEDAARFWVHREDDVEFDDDGERVQGYTVRGRAGYVSGRFYHPSLAQHLCDDLNLADASFPKSMGVIQAEAGRFHVERMGSAGWCVVGGYKGRDVRFGFPTEELAIVCCHELNIDPSIVDPNRVGSRGHDDASCAVERENARLHQDEFDVEPAYLEGDGPMESEARRDH